MFIHSFLDIFNDELRSLVVYFLFEFECCNTIEQKKRVFELLKTHPIYKIVANHEALMLEPDMKGGSVNYQKLRSLVKDFSMGKYAEVMTLVLMSLPKSVLSLERSGWEKEEEIIN